MPEQALEAAMRVFWAEGYDAASIDQLCRETHMPRSSLYQTYGNKEELFLAVIAHYVKTQLAPLTDALGPSGTLKADLSSFFNEVVALATRDSRTPGCLISCVLAEVAGANEIAQRLAYEDGAQPNSETQALAGMLAAVARGIMLRARSGARRADLQAVAVIAVKRAV